MMEEIDIAETLQILFNPPKSAAKWFEIDKVEKYLSTLPTRVMGDLYEEGTPGLYTRQLTIPAETLITSSVHKTCHPFIITKGVVTVYNAFDNSQILYKSGDRGITYPGARRVLYVHEETEWITFHSTNRIGNDFIGLDKQEQQAIFTLIMQDILQVYYNPCLVDFDEGIFI
jgi:hypothetical protein